MECIKPLKLLDIESEKLLRTHFGSQDVAMDTIVADFYSDVAVRQVRTKERRFDSDGSFLPGIGNVSAEQKDMRADVRCGQKLKRTPEQICVTSHLTHCSYDVVGFNNSLTLAQICLYGNHFLSPHCF